MINFRLLKQPQDHVGKCTEILPNKMQCYSAADFELTDSSNDPNFQVRQVCRFHARLIDQAQKQQAALVVNPVPEPTKTEKKIEPKSEPTQTTIQKDTVNVIPIKPTTTS